MRLFITWISFKQVLLHLGCINHLKCFIINCSNQFLQFNTINTNKCFPELLILSCYPNQFDSWFSFKELKYAPWFFSLECHFLSLDSPNPQEKYFCVLRSVILSFYYFFKKRFTSLIWVTGNCSYFFFTRHFNSSTVLIFISSSSLMIDLSCCGHWKGFHQTVPSRFWLKEGPHRLKRILRGLLNCFGKRQLLHQSCLLEKNRNECWGLLKPVKLILRMTLLSLWWAAHRWLQLIGRHQFQPHRPRSHCQLCASVKLLRHVVFLLQNYAGVLMMNSFIKFL